MIFDQVGSTPTPAAKTSEYPNGGNKSYPVEF